MTTESRFSVKPAGAVLLAILGSISIASAAEVRAIFPKDAPKPTASYSPGLLAGDYLFVSSQGPRRGDGDIPDSVADQTEQCLANVRAVVEAAELTMEHVVYTHVYLVDMTKDDEMNSAYAKSFPATPPARAVVGVAKRPSKILVTINAVAVRDLSHKQPVQIAGFEPDEPYTPAVLTGDMLFLSAMLGRDLRSGEIPSDVTAQVDLALDNLGETLKAAGLGFEHMVFVNPYLTQDITYGELNGAYRQRFEFGNTPARATIFVSSLPREAKIEFTGVAVRDLSKRRAVRPKNMNPSPTASPCVFAGDWYFCSAKSGFIPGVNGGIWASTPENQFRQTMRNLLDGLEEAGLDFSNVVSTTLYFDDRRDYDKLNPIYEEYFTDGPPPSRTTVQQLPAAERKPRPNGRWPTLEQMSLIGLR